MLITIEKVAILSKTRMFADILDYVLASVAAIMEEVALNAGQTFIEEGAVEDCLYVVVDGRVQVHSNGRGEDPSKKWTQELTIWVFSRVANQRAA